MDDYAEPKPCCSTTKALPLEELEMHFCGPLPPDSVNEQEVPSETCRELNDPLAAGQKVKALKVHVGTTLTCIWMEQTKSV